MDDRLTDAVVTTENVKEILENTAYLEKLRSLTVADYTEVLGEECVLSDISDAYSDLFDKMHGGFGFADKLCFCSSVVGKYGADKLFDLIIPHTSALPCNIATVDNYLSKTAFGMINTSGNFSSVECSSFSELYELLENGSIDACLLPIENTSSGKLFNFYSVIDKYDLKIITAVDVEDTDGDNITVFALLCKEFADPGIDGGICRFEFSVYTDGTDTWDMLLNAEKCLDISICRIDSVRQKYSSDGLTINAVLSGKLDSILAMILFLILADYRFSFIGIYK